MKRIFIYFLLLGIPLYGRALSLAPIFSGNMVLQQGKQTRIWGSASVGETVGVRMNKGDISTCITDSTGNWFTYMDTGEPGGPYVLEVFTPGDTLILENVYVGDVWLAGGQSNMYFTLNKHLDAAMHIQEADDLYIRYARIPVTLKENEKPEEIQWKEICRENAGWVSAVAYFFAKKLREHISYPIGIISCNRGSTSAETWISEEYILKDSLLTSIYDSYQIRTATYKEGEYDSLYLCYRKNMDAYNEALKKGDKNLTRPVEPMGIYHPQYPSAMYKTMLTQVIPFTLKGIIWYQGEANARDAESYKHTFPALIADWRSQFENPGLPFYFVQLSNYDVPRLDKEAWARTREVQYQVSKDVPYTAMAVSIDCGEEKDIHPRNKKPVGERLGLLALNHCYGMPLPCQSPEVKKVRIKKDRITVTFKYVYKGLMTDPEGVKGFSICESDTVFYPADARVTGKNRVEVRSPQVKHPKYVRYRFINWSEGNLFNSEGLPCIPFRTDTKN